MFKPRIVLVLIIAASALLTLAPVAEASSRDSDAIIVKIERLLNTSEIVEIGDVSIATEEFRTYYQGRGYAPIWVTGAKLRRAAGILLGALKAAGLDGLNQADYGLQEIETRFGYRSVEALSALDVLLSAALVRYARDLSSGRQAPLAAQPELFVYRRDADPVKLLSDAAGADNLALTLAGLVPNNPFYLRLKQALRDYNALSAKADWPTLAAGPAIKPGAMDARVPALRQRLTSSRDLSHQAFASGQHYDEAIEQAVHRFQSRHGLEPDGVVGEQTRAALNVSIHDRIRQIIINMERWRWGPGVLGEKYVLVNMAAFRLEAVASGRRELDMRVVVGRTYRRAMTESW